MRLAMIGLGRMGMNMAKRLLHDGHEIVAYDHSPGKTDTLVSEEEGVTGSYLLADVVQNLPKPRVIWLMIPSGKPVDDHIDELRGLLAPGDIIIDGGNTYYKDDIRRSDNLRAKNIHYLDVGVSGGIWGLKTGYCLMIGGDKTVFESMEPVFKTLAPEGGCLYCGETGAGHFVKMVHNGIEYGMMQAYAEGFDILEASCFGNGFDYQEIARLWNRGSVVRSWLLELLESAFSHDPRLEGIRGYVEDSGEGRWMVQQAMETDVPAPVIALSLFQRFGSRRENRFADRVLAALRREFGGHPVKPSRTPK
jgi:6-phosphogluconate dehydrogenase